MTLVENHEIIGMKIIDVSKIENVCVFMRRILIEIHQKLVLY